MSDSDRRDSLRRAEEFLGIFSRGAAFTKELLDENERLRRRLAAVEGRQENAAQSSDEWGKLRGELLERIRGLEAERADVMERLASVEEENRHFACRYVEIEEENNNLANLYISSYQLHSTLDLEEVYQVIVEIVINLVGAERFAVYAIHEGSPELKPVACEGDELGSFPVAELGRGPIGRALVRGEVEVGERDAAGDPERPYVSIPLRVSDKPVGAIAIFDLLQQKDGLTPLDHELFTLLAGHAATAIMAARLYAQSERKLNTIQGFLDLLTK